MQYLVQIELQQVAKITCSFTFFTRTFCGKLAIQNISLWSCFNFSPAECVADIASVIIIRKFIGFVVIRFIFVNIKFPWPDFFPTVLLPLFSTFMLFCFTHPVYLVISAPNRTLLQMNSLILINLVSSANNVILDTAVNFKGFLVSRVRVV